MRTGCNLARAGVSHTLPPMKLATILVLLSLTLASAQGQILRSGVMGRPARHEHESGRHERLERDRRDRGDYRRHHRWHGRPHVHANWHAHRPVYAHRTYRNFGYSYPIGSFYGPIYGGTYAGSTDGFWLGALAGGIVGHNSGAFRHNAWRGAAWGAGTGWLLGTIADANRRSRVYRAAQVIATQPTTIASAPVTQREKRAPVTVLTPPAGNVSPMAAANSLFGRN